MFAGFNLAITSQELKELVGSGNFDYYKKIGREHLKPKKAIFEENIQKYIENGIADGTKIENDWFPKIETDIFISHSHIDEEISLTLAGWLHDEFQIDCFIDSCVWGYAGHLLELINKEYSDKRKDDNGGYLYNHEKCNTASKHVNIMLCMALQKMIDKVEATFVINTRNSIDKYKDVYEDSTFSPWIYTEIVCTQIVRHKRLSEYRKKHLIKKEVSESYSEIQQEFKAVYEVSLDHLKILNKEILNNWGIAWKDIDSKSNMYALDELYKIVIPEAMEDIRRFYKEHLAILG
ncbi:hypothetical protein [Tissierella pigra]|uniref:Uncharacterized protein n=1 Tax=Tissierella pigra TaxID=2607614 RepID=A0A6N7XQV4_9FIRM|nr:hypothetical protein [Tissierella pigra]MSU00127.1 hypothetical protein [Tissierella pigra]